MILHLFKNVTYHSDMFRYVFPRSPTAIFVFPKTLWRVLFFPELYEHYEQYRKSSTYSIFQSEQLGTL